MKDYKAILLFTLVFLVCFLQTGSSFASNSNQKGTPKRQELRSACKTSSSNDANNNSNILADNNNPAQLLVHRSIKFAVVKNTPIVLNWQGLCPGIFKHRLKSISYDRTRYLRLLLFPHHSFD